MDGVRPVSRFISDMVKDGNKVYNGRLIGTRVCSIKWCNFQ